MARDLFLTVMEAEGDLVQPFEDGEDTSPTEDTAPEQASPEPDGMDDPPPLSDDDTMSFDDGSNLDDTGGGSESDDVSEESTNNGGEKLSEKANQILNQKLYQRMLDRNHEIEDIIENVQKIVPLLPYEIVKENDVSLTRLKSALEKAEDYVINKFLDAQYGENLLFFQKLDSLYTLLLDRINDNLKALNKS